MTKGVSDLERAEDKVIGGEGVMDLRGQVLRGLSGWILKLPRMRTELVSKGMIVRHKLSPSRYKKLVDKWKRRWSVWFSLLSEVRS